MLAGTSAQAVITLASFSSHPAAALQQMDIQESTTAQHHNTAFYFC